MKRIIMLAVVLVMALGAAAWTLGAEAKAGKENKPVLALTAEETENQLVFRNGPEGKYGPSDFVVLDKNEVLILDAVAKRVQRFKDNNLTATINLNAVDGELFLLETVNGYAYALGKEQLAEIDLMNNEVIWYDFPENEEAMGGLGLYVYDITVRDNQLVMITGSFGNYTVNREAGQIVKTALGYTAFFDGNGIDVYEAGKSWNPKEIGTTMDVLQLREDGSILVQAVKFSGSISAKDYLTVRDYSPEGEVRAQTSIDINGWKTIPRRFAKVYNGELYLLVMTNEGTTVSRLDMEAK